MKSALIVGIGALACAMFCGWASAAVVTWDMGVDLSSAGQASPMSKSEDGYGDIASGDFNPPVSAGINPLVPPPITPDYISYARFVDTGGHGNDGFTYQNGVNGTVSQTFTVDMIVWGERALNSTGRSASIRVGNNGETASTALGLEPGAVWDSQNQHPDLVGGNSLWMTIRNGAYVPYGFLFTKTTEDYGWRAIRLVSPGDGSLLVYDFVDGSGTGTLAGTVPSGSMPGGAQVGALGFSLNSISGGVVSSSGFSALGVAMNNDTALDGSAAYMLPPVPEPASLLLVLFGGLTLIRRRR
ncbi:MAG: PEP-CTERM sorting domain-containing protein [Planctomycetes bacterium]|nr:PEP-CTERM sorting domain-containing protein [Planctomycetota bacterium]